MIARRWSGVVARADRDEYVAYVQHTGVAEYQRTAGCRLACILTRDLDQLTGATDSSPRTEVVAFSLWDSESHIRAFTGEDITAMVLYPQDEAYLLEPPALTHFEAPMFAVPNSDPTSG